MKGSMFICEAASIEEYVTVLLFGCSLIPHARVRDLMKRDIYYTSGVVSWRFELSVIIVC